MDPAQFGRTFSFEEGFFPSQHQYEGLPGTARDGLNAWLVGGLMVSDKGSSSAGTSGAHPLMIAAGNIVGMSGGLGVVLSHLSAYWFAGIGNAIVNGAIIGTSTGKMVLVVGGVAYTVGLSQPTTAPALAVSATASGIMGGSYAFAYCTFRASTGAVSSRSLISAPIAVNKKKVDVTLPGVGTNPDGITHYLLYGSRRNFAGLGLVFRITSVSEIPVTATAQTVSIEYQDGDLGDAAPLTNAPPPPCTHCCVLGGVMVAISAGAMCYPSKAGLPEAYDVGLAVRLPSGEAPTCVIPQGVEGGVFVGTRNSIGILVLSGSADVPILPRGVFAHTGVAHGNAMCWAMNQLWGMSSIGNPFRSQGNDAPDSSFAQPVMRYLQEHGFTGDSTSVVYDEANGAILFCSGSVALPFMLASGRWSTPIAFTGTVNAGIAFNGAGTLQTGSSLFTLNSATSGGPLGAAFLQSAYFGAGGRIVSVDECFAAGVDNATIDLLADLGGSVGGKFPLAFLAPHGNPKALKPHRKARSLAVKVTASGGNKTFPHTTIGGTVEPTLA